MSILDPDPYSARCPSREVLDRVGDRWTVLVISLLAQRTRRFTELRHAIDGISPKVLTSTLRGLERDGLVTRTVYAEVPPRVEYAITPLGGTLVDAVEALASWAATHLPEVEEAREAYDSR